MKSVGVAQVGRLQIEGFKGDYIFQILSDTHDFYESSLLETWSPLIGSPQTILDIGANIGNHSLYWATKLKPHKIYAFEPLASVYQRLCGNIARNGLEGQIVPIEKAVGAAAGFAQVKRLDEHNYGATILQTTSEEQTDGLPLISVDSFVREQELELVDFIKIDVEQFELAVLEGAQQTLDQMHPALWIEVTRTTHQKVLQILFEKGYRLVDVNRFNLLFLHPQKYPDAREIEERKLLESFYQILEQADQAAGRSKQLQARLSELDQKYRQSDERYGQLRDKYRQLDERHGQLRDKYRQLDERHGQLRDQYRQLDERHGQLRDQYRQLDERHGQLRDKHRQLDERHSKLRDEYHRLDKRYEALSQQEQQELKNHQMLDERCGRLEEECRVLREKYQRADEQCGTFKAKLSHGDGRLKVLTEQAAALSQRLEHSDQEVQRRKAQLEEAWARLHVQKVEKEACDKRMEQMAEQINRLQSAFEKAQNENISIKEYLVWLSEQWPVKLLGREAKEKLYELADNKKNDSMCRR